MAVLDEALEREYAMLTTRSKALAIEGEGDEYAIKKERREEPPTPTPWGESRPSLCLSHWVAWKYLYAG